LLVAEKCKLVKYLTWSRALLLAFELADSWFQIILHDRVRLCETSFREMMTLE
jgi:hypothetical protein